MKTSAFVGIDLAFAKGKRLPVCAVVRDEATVRPLILRSAGSPTPPRGLGNPAAIQDEAVAEYAHHVAAYLRKIEQAFSVSIQRIAIDAPSAPRLPHLPRRLAEQALDKAGISCFATPCEADWAVIRTKVRTHLSAGGAVARLPHANQLWMLVGFALFRVLSEDWECIEVYPQATSFVLGSNSVHKSSSEGVAAQLAAASVLTGWPSHPTGELLHQIAWAPLHDCLDAYLAAWVASLNPTERRAFGHPPSDVIWVPASTRGV